MIMFVARCRLADMFRKLSVAIDPRRRVRVVKSSHRSEMAGHPAVPTQDDIFVFRKKRGWSQTELAEHLGVNQATVSRWESKGLPPSVTAHALVSRIVDEAAA